MVDGVLGFVGELILEALLNVVGLQLAHELERLAHELDTSLFVGVDLLLLLLEFLLLVLHLDGLALENEVDEVDKLELLLLPVVVEHLDLLRLVPDLFKHQ